MFLNIFTFLYRVFVRCLHFIASFMSLFLFFHEDNKSSGTYVLRNVGLLQQDYRALYSRWLSYSYSPPREPETSTLFFLSFRFYFFLELFHSFLTCLLLFLYFFKLSAHSPKVSAPSSGQPPTLLEPARYNTELAQIHMQVQKRDSSGRLVGN
jgi:hypothetical protein